jgi:hypothetical protein
MKIVIENTKFSYEDGCRLLKTKSEVCPFEELEGVWDSIEPMTFKDVARLENLEQRRVGIICLGLERLISEVNPTLLNKETIQKKTSWVDEKGELVEKSFDDTYELFEVDGAYFSEGLNSYQKMRNSYFVRCKDTSTSREYLLWVDLGAVSETNGGSRWNFNPQEVNAIQSIAWTIQTNVPKGNIEKIIRQGDCVLIKPKRPNEEMLNNPRHLTEEEYRTLLVAES